MRSTHDHELVINSETRGMDLVVQNGTAMYSVTEEIPDYKNPLRFIQSSWIGGHGQYDFSIEDKFYEGQSIDTTQDGVVFLAPEIVEVKKSDAANIGAPTCFEWFPAVTNFYVASNTAIYVYDATNVNFVICNTVVTNVTDLKVFGTGMFAARGSTVNYSYSTDGNDWAATTLTDGFAEKFIVAPNPAGTADIFWKFKKPNEVTSTTNAISTEWTSPAYIGDTACNITNLMLINDNFLVGREDGLYHYDSNGGVHPLMPDLRWLRSTNNFKYVTDWQTGIYFSLGRGGGEITSYNSFEPMSPILTDDIGKIGDIVGMTADKDYLYIAVKEQTNTIIYKCRETRHPKYGLRWEYCPFVFLGTNVCQSIMVCQHSATDRRLWFGYGNNAAFVKLSDNPLADSNYRFCSSGFVRMSYENGTQPYFGKIWHSLVTQTNSCTANRTVTVKYRKDTETTANACSNAITTNGLLKTNFISTLNCNRIQFELDLTSALNTATPQVTHFEARGVEKPEYVRVHECVYKVGDNPSNKTETLRTFLRNGRTANTLIKFADLRYGDQTSTTDYVYCVLEPGYPQEIEVLQEKGKSPELGIRVRLREVDFTVTQEACMNGQSMLTDAQMDSEIRDKKSRDELDIWTAQQVYQISKNCPGCRNNSYSKKQSNLAISITAIVNATLAFIFAKFGGG